MSLQVLKEAVREYKVAGITDFDRKFFSYIGISIRESEEVL